MDAGLPSILIPSTAVFPSPQSFHLTPVELDGDLNLKDRMEALRLAASNLHPSLSSALSPSSPKICVVGPPTAYTTTGGLGLRPDEMDYT